MMTFGSLTLPDFERIPHSLSEWLFAEGRSAELLAAVRDQLMRLAPMGEDEYRSLWICVPRGTSEDWCPYDWWRGSDEDTYERYLEEWRSRFPREEGWFRVFMSQYEGMFSIRITDERDYRCLIRNYDNGDSVLIDLEAFLEQFLAALTDLVDQICRHPDAYNGNVRKMLPAQYRFGRISRKDLVTAAPSLGLEVYEPEVAAEALRKILANEIPCVSKMTLRDYAGWYTRAWHAFYSEKKIYNDYEARFGNQDLLKSYEILGWMSLGEYDADSEEDFKKAAVGHYGEIDLTRLDILAVHDYEDEGWMIYVRNSYSCYIGEAINIVAALYKAGAPVTLSLESAETYLAAVEQRDSVRIKPYTYHDYASEDDGCGGAIELPFEDEITFCSRWSLSSLRDVISKAVWDEIPEVIPVGKED